MASTALEEKINKIRLRNEEIKRRYEEVEADKKNAAKLDALVEPVPSEDWPERKEPPEFSAPALKHTNKLKHSVRKHNDQTTQYYTGSGDGKKAHNFADGQGPPPDPKYNFLADSEREEHGEETPRDTERNRGRSKPTRGVFKRRGSGRDWHAKEQWNQQGYPGDATRPDYEAWRAERNRIDEARISRQRTAEGNWRREWDNDKVHLADEISKRDNRVTLGDVVTRQEHSDNEKLYRPPRTAPGNSQYSNARESYHGSIVSEANRGGHCSVNDPEKRVVIATDRSIKVMLNPGSTPPKSSVMSVKVSPPNIAGTGRVGPRQRPRVMYSSQSEAEASSHESPTFTRQKSADEKTKGRPFDQTQKVAPPKSPHPQRKRDSDPKSPYPQRKDNDRGDKVEGTPKSGKKDSPKSPYPQKRGNTPSNYPPKSPRVHRQSTAAVKNDSAKLPRAHQERNREKCNTNSVSVESKGENSDGDVLVSADASTASRHDKSNEFLNHFDNIDKRNENVPIKQTPPEGSTNLAELPLESDKNFISDKVAQNGSEPLEETSLELSTSISEAIVKSAENNSANETIKQSPLETSANASEPSLESGENCVIDHGKGNDGALLKQPTLESSTSPAEGVPYSAENDTVKESKEIHGEASGTQKPNDASSDDIDGRSMSNRAAINCSADSGLTSNDSGFLELPSNDSIHNVSGNGNVETSDFAETSMDSIQSGNEVMENRPIVENLEVEPKVAEAAVGDTAEPSSSDLKKTEENSSTNVLEQVEKISHNAAIDVGHVIFEENDIVKTTNAPHGAENNSQNTINDATKLERHEKDSATSSNVHEGTENNADVMENYNVELESIKLKLQEKDIVNSIIHDEAGNNSNKLKSEEKNPEKTENTAEAVKDAQELQNSLYNKSAIVLESSNNIGQEIADGAVNDIDPNGIDKEKTVEPAIAETLNSLATKKLETVEEKMN